MQNCTPAQVIERDLQIQEREKLFVQLKTALNKQPGVEVFAQMQTLQAAVKSRYIDGRRIEAGEQQKEQQLQEQPADEASRTDTFFSSSTFEYLTGGASSIQS
ncbi:hypothetical protein, conserved [Eimeria tenella]|uniref:Uncharacterized protein n=1 Tax=Eimeria tenella TaxID=5802 RepID=U6L073_EIMTE|nr:hypothetical protein, conserved [Eimeria tenella]CDJ41160.1 hypothetical protein, conserved [Eimeria tenella]|eukprot:XP_013231910.1 hypothetical protein, conserved [Eimeria tenella]